MFNSIFFGRSDVFSFGVILWELMTVSIPWNNLNPIQVSLSLSSLLFLVQGWLSNVIELLRLYDYKIVTKSDLASISEAQ